MVCHISVFSDDLAGSDSVDFGKCPETFEQYPLSKIDTDCLNSKHKIFKRYDSKIF